MRDDHMCGHLAAVREKNNIYKYTDVRDYMNISIEVLVGVFTSRWVVRVWAQQPHNEYKINVLLYCCFFYIQI